MARSMLKADYEDLVQRLIKALAESGALGAVDNDEEERSESPITDRQLEKKIHRTSKRMVCTTDERGFATPDDVDPNSIVLDASEGFIPLWRYGTTLRWCFDEVALSSHEQRSGVKRKVRELMQEAMLAWGDAAPIRLKEERDSYDFRVVVNANSRCTPFGCTLASAFFPDSGRHNFHVYPEAFEQSRKEQVDTFIHELGHVFGLRHFFAQVREQAWPSVIFGKHRAFSIMNYGEQSELTEDDRSDLRELYRAVWSGVLTNVNGTPIRLFAPYHEAGELVTPRFFDTRSAIE
ncbi:zinc-dependent metalloprotease family protein [Rhodopirellula baltica]|uniref:Similar to matrix metalloproteinase-11 n=1 Tax=Rhodopirellula baltica (strain DSM 10527 / NCIMB 13988 / SH1) TaxID=243090 RepID=Q7USV3_RHOBA|nr:zinc-dependent metalloprotease family protein [Rhodopirellula baltica]CAD73689.1 similar to matrix metalloproteinase-11 [Rhodopirellula baltica SH 1]